MHMTYAQPTQYDYNGLDDVSRFLNWVLLDRTGRTITQRTQDGFAALSDGKWRWSGFIVHAIMIVGVLLAFSKHKAVRWIGIALLVLIGIAWLFGGLFR
jgi:hypothetical protein